METGRYKPVGEQLGQLAQKKCSNCGVFRVVHHVHVDDVHRSLCYGISGVETFQDLIINFLLHCQNYLKLFRTVLELFWSGLEIKKLVIAGNFCKPTQYSL